MYEKKDYQIWRSTAGYEFRALCVDQDGEPVLDVHEDTPDDEIWNILFWIRHAYENGVRAGKEDNTWIDADKELPEDDVPVLVYFGDDIDVEIDYCKTGEHYGTTWFANDPDRAITKWKPFNKPGN